MRPIPSSKHHWAALVLLTVVAVNTLLTFRQTNITGDQANMLAEVAKLQDPSLYPHDGVFADSSAGAAWRGRLPAWQFALSTAIRLGGADPLNGFRILGAVIALLYLVFMYVLIYRQTHSTTAATVVALLSTAIFSTRRPFWGVGPIFAVTPENVVLAFTPLAVTLLLGARRKWKVVGVFAGVGLLGNIHLTSAANLTIVLLITLIAHGRARMNVLVKAVVAAVVAVVAAAAALLHCRAVLTASGAAEPQMSVAAVRGMLNMARIKVLYPDALVEVLWWLPLAGVLAVPAAVILVRAGRYRIREQAVWLWFLAAAMGVTLLLQGAGQLSAQARGTPPAVIEFFAALKLAMLPLYVFFAQAAVHLFRQTHRHRGWLRAALLVFAVVYLGSSFNTRTVRHLVQDSIELLARPRAADPADAAQDAPPQLQPDWEAVLRGRTRRQRADEARALAEWAGRDGHTPVDALFITNREEFRSFGRRSVLCCADDVRYLYHFAPQHLARWNRRLRKQRELLSPPQAARADAAEIAKWIDAIRTQDQIAAAPLYVVLRAGKAPLPGDRLAEVAPPGGLWGRHWRLFRVLPPPPQPTASGPASRPASRPATAPTSP